VAAPPFRAGEEITTGVLYRRIPPLPDYWVDDEDPPRPSGLNFMPDTGEPYVSMELKDPNDPDQPRKILGSADALPGSGLIEIDVETVREFRLTVTYEPAYGDLHFGVSGWEQMTKKDAVRTRRKLSYRARVIQPPTVERPTAT